ncbi:phage holin family protein [Candidatus Gracilibacteria bacterium]|nr:phage holin family protein [Candidatus Gracilibacteria bacterium]
MPQPQPLDWRRLLLRWLIMSIAIFAAITLVPGIEYVGPGWQVGGVAVIVGLLNILLRPLLYLLTCSLVILTAGLFGLVINAGLLLLAAEIASWFNIQFTIDGFWPAFWGALVISLVSLALNLLTGEGQVRVMRWIEGTDRR